jgi:uncharacterized protein (TIGR03546 family)
MLQFALRPVRQLAQALIANDSPRQVAWGFVIGMLIGLVPKGNLTAVLLGVLLLGLRVNKPAGLMGAGLFSMLGLVLDPIAHRIGSAVLVWQPLREIHTSLYNAAISPITGLNNTVVVGQLLIGLYFAYPVYWLAHRFAVKVQAPLSAWLMRYRAVRWLRGAELGTQWGIEG